MNKNEGKTSRNYGSFLKKKIKIKKKILTETDLKEIMHAKRKKNSDRENF